MKKDYLNHLNIPSAFEEAGELSTVYAKWEITDEQFEVRGEIGIAIVAQDLLVLPKLGGNGDLPGKPRRQAREAPGGAEQRSGNANEVSIKLERRGRKGAKRKQGGYSGGEGESFRSERWKDCQGRSTGGRHGCSLLLFAPCTLCPRIRQKSREKQEGVLTPNSEEETSFYINKIIVFFMNKITDIY